MSAIQKIFFVSINDISKNSNFSKTVLEGIEVCNYPELEYLTKKDKMFLWGINEKIRAPFDIIQPGDITLFYHKQKIVAVGLILNKTINRTVSELLWGSFQKHSVKTFWANILIFDEVNEIDMDFEEIIKFGKYKKGFIIRKMIPANEATTIEFLQRFQSVENFVKEYSSH